MILITKVIPFSDPDNESLMFDKAKYKEIQGLERRNVWKTIKITDVSNGFNVISGRFVCSIKNVGTPEEKTKPRFAARGHLDKEEKYLIHQTTIPSILQLEL